MYHENDKHIIPERYLQMSPAELRAEKTRLLKEMKSQALSKKYAKKTNKVGNITFKFWSSQSFQSWKREGIKGTEWIVTQVY